MTIQLTLSPRKKAVSLDQTSPLEVLVRAIGPAFPSRSPARKALNLALVIDKSGSMGGQPLDEAKRCAIAIVDRMAPGDYVSVVAYDQAAELVWPAQTVSTTFELRQAIASIHEGGTTALHDGWAAGAEQAAMNVSRAGISRVLLLSDGCANQGLTDPDRIASHCALMAEKGISTSTYGLGSGFNEELMLGMANQGGGNGYYGQTAADLMGPFQEEFDLLQAIYARNLCLSLSAEPGVRISVANDLRETPGGWRLPDLAFGSEAWALVRISVTADLLAGGESLLPLFKATLTYDTDTGSGQSGPVGLALPPVSATAFAAAAEDNSVARRAQEVRFAEFQREAASAARRGDWSQVDAVLEQARSEAQGNEWLSSTMQSLER
ncbi:MAG: VWA domain-containing protein, partial [Caulobacteraceae bacterium]|nr:VWA domain-containing protein [Caulobacteraceae bacterium]